MSRREEGQAAVLIVGLVGVIALLVVVVVNASAVFIERQRLGDLADAAALSAADALDTRHFYEHGFDGDDAPLLPAGMDEAVGSYLRATGDGDVTWTVQVTDTEVTVRLQRTVPLPFTPPGWSPGTTVGADSTAVLRLDR